MTDNAGMYIRVWEYDVLPQHHDEFERAYRGDGEWAQLFSRVEGYAGTELYRSAETAGRYLTVDRFRTEDAWQKLRRDHAADYELLDAQCDGLTSTERELAP